MRVSQDTFTKEQLNITNVKIPSTVSSTFANRHKPSRRPKFAKELETLPPEKNNFFKFPPLLKNFKTCHRTADTASETHTDSSLTMTKTEGQLTTAVLQKRGCSASVDSFFVLLECGFSNKLLC